VAPENRARPDGRTVKIAVARARSTSANPKPDPMLYLAGGPGGPGLPLGNTLVAAGINRDRDVIVNDLASFDTSENASDIADLRTALGIREWNVYGVSYGSDLALQLLRDHPDGIRSLTVDSVVAPQINLIERFWPSAAEGLTALFDACAAEPTCARAYPGRGAGARIRQSSRSGGLRPDL
jgi:pimeloyl-ACP methyl ester carboxylesterase